MIIGIGTDIVSVQRMRDSMEKMGAKFPKRLLTEPEYDEFVAKKNGPAFLAKRFAAKEALVKALGTGFAKGITWKQITVRNDGLGAPFLELSGATQEKANALGVTQIHLSLSDEQAQAVAFVILEG
ncbi:holo-ACP synthase [Ketobacter sp. MCCC 1A13808]|uniref:holo-ACP synthase n=1 Tax=Ketobacter sp. MCCC 1A13808 TaxID=2602738 RepID=UPI0012EC3990|nr:holo-ACP synthase [Ketobacter sp. MCCC 1A13808]MVF14682.1 holo-ACP synthase [Ketobacter sp. MCCC 1A13808]